MQIQGVENKAIFCENSESQQNNERLECNVKESTGVDFIDENAPKTDNELDLNEHEKEKLDIFEGSKEAKL